MESKSNTPAIEFEEKLNSFLKGEMTSAEEQEFKVFLNTHPRERQKAIAIARLSKAMRQVGVKQDKAVIDDFKSASQKEAAKAAAAACGIKAKPEIMNFRRFVVSLSVAASILLCIIGGYRYYKYDQTISLGQEYLAYFPATEYCRGEGDDMAEKIGRLYSNISDRRDMAASIKELSQMWDASRSDTYNEFTEYMPELGWMLANAYLCINEKEKAIEALDQLIEECSADTAIGEKARELKQKVEKL